MVTLRTRNIPKAEQLRDLKARAEKAAALADEYERAGIETMRRKAEIRWWRRVFEYTHLEQMPDGAVCMACVQPDGDWPADFWRDDRKTWLCLDHAEPMHERMAVERVALEEGEHDATE